MNSASTPENSHPRPFVKAPAVKRRARRRDAGRHKTATILQMEALECGAAALAIILAYHGRWVSLEELRVKCGVSRDGVRASNILRAARGFGMIARGFKKEPQELRMMPLPVIVFWDFKHYVVVEGFKGDKVYLNDPGAGPRVISGEEFDLFFTGVALTFEIGPDFKPGGRPRSLSGALRRQLSGTKEALAYLILVGIALVFAGLLIPLLTSLFIDKVMGARLDHWLMPLVLGLVVMGSMRMALTWLESYYLLRVRTQLVAFSSSRLFWHLLRLPIVFYSQRSPGELASRVDIHDRVAGSLFGDLAQSALALLQIFFFGAALFCCDVYLALISVTVGILDLVITRWTAMQILAISHKLSLTGGKAYSATLNGLEVMETIKSTGCESDYFAQWAGAQAKLVNFEQDKARMTLLMQAGPELLGAVGAMLLLGVGGIRVIEGHLSIGMLVAVLSLAASFSGRIDQVLGIGRKVSELKGDINRLDDVLQYPLDGWLLRDELAAAALRDRSEAQQTAGEGLPQAGMAVPLAARQMQSGHAKLEGRIEIIDLSFGYTQSGAALIQHFNLLIEPGERVAIVGPSGCGKSTVSRMLAGLYEPWQGEIRFDDKLRVDYPRQVFFNSVALVDQEIMLFEGTVRDNLTMWDRSISDRDMVQAAKDACIHDFIMSRPGAYESLIEEGGQNISGGQRQRLEIARALATNPRVVVMDEATSALDPPTEQQIDLNLRRRGCTCVIIAHRLSTIRDAEEIIVLNAGQLVERGDHEELMKIPDGFYKNLLAQG